MGFLGVDESMAKGVVTRCLDHISVGHRARQNMENLRAKLIDIRRDKVETINGVDHVIHDFKGLEAVFHSDLFPHLLKSQTDMDEYRDQLEEFWFGDNAKLFHGKGFRMRSVYGQGVLKTLNASLSGSPDPIPIDSYWLAICTTVEMIVLKRARQVTLLVCTPVPDAGAMGTTANPQAACEAWGTRFLSAKMRAEVVFDENADESILSPGSKTNPRVCTYKCVGGF